MKCCIMCNLFAECPRSPVSDSPKGLSLAPQSVYLRLSEEATVSLPDLLNDVWRNRVSLQEITGRHRGSNVTQSPSPPTDR